MLDINTKKGQKTLEEERSMISHINDKWNKRGISIVQTLKDRPADCDGFLIKNNEIVGLFESKCRTLTYDQLLDYGTWLITFSKLEKCRNLSLALQVPFLGFLYLVPDNIVLSFKIADNGVYCFDFKTQLTKTQTTVNGGEIYRENSYIPIKYGKII